MEKEIRELLENAISDIFLHFQKKYDIEDGDITPLCEFLLDEKTDELAKIIKTGIENQIYFTNERR